MNFLKRTAKDFQNPQKQLSRNCPQMKSDLFSGKNDIFLSNVVIGSDNLVRITSILQFKQFQFIGGTGLSPPNVPKFNHKSQADLKA